MASSCIALRAAAATTPHQHAKLSFPHQLACTRTTWHGKSQPGKYKNRQTALHATSQDQKAASAFPATPGAAAAAVRELYAAYDRGDVEGVAAVLAEDVVHHDAIWNLEPTFGLEAVTSHYAKLLRNSGVRSLRTVVTEVAGDDASCGVAWHTEVDGELFPFSRGCSFYKVNAEGKIAWSRDCMEAAPPKPGDGTLGALEGLVPAIRGIGAENADPANLTKVPFEAAIVWLLYAGFLYWILFSPIPPGIPSSQIDARVVAEVSNESLNLFYVNILLDSLGVSPIPSVAEHPVSEAVFNLLNAWSMMLLPVLLTEPRSQKVPQKLGQWIAIMFVWGFAMFPFMAQRAAPDEHPSGLQPPLRTSASLSSSAAAEHSASIRAASEKARGEKQEDPRWYRVLGGVGLVIGAVSLCWFLLGRPENGDVAARISYFTNRLGSERAFYTFMCDLGLYWVWQYQLMSSSGAARRYSAVPFFGLGAWLIAGRPQQS